MARSESRRCHRLGLLPSSYTDFPAVGKDLNAAQSVADTRTGQKALFFFRMARRTIDAEHPIRVQLAHGMRHQFRKELECGNDGSLGDTADHRHFMIKHQPAAVLRFVIRGPQQAKRRVDPIHEAQAFIGSGVSVRCQPGGEQDVLAGADRTNDHGTVIHHTQIAVVIDCRFEIGTVK